MPQPPAIIRLVSAANVPPPTGIPSSADIITWLSDGAFPIANVAGFLQPGTRPYDIVFSLPGKPNGSFTYPWLAIGRPLILPANLAGAVGKLIANPAGTTTFTINKTTSGTTTGIATVSFATSGVPTFATTGGVAINLAVNDFLTLVTPTQDASLSGLMLTVQALR